MEKQMIMGKAALAATMTTVLSCLGYKGILGLIWLLAMALDYISGTAAAMKEGAWQSSMARAGLFHKAGMMLSVAVAGVGDLAMTMVLGNIPLINMRWPGALLPLVLSWYILTELGSVLENAIKLGAPVPKWLMTILKTGREAVDQQAQENT